MDEVINGFWRCERRHGVKPAKPKLGMVCMDIVKALHEACHDVNTVTRNLVIWINSQHTQLHTFFAKLILHFENGSIPQSTWVPLNHIHVMHM